MRIEATATSISWIPSDSVWSTMRRGFDLGLAHWDAPLPETVDSPGEVHELCRQDRFRFANVLSGWAEFDDGRVVASGVTDDSGLVMGATTVRVRWVGGVTFQAASLPVIRPEPQHGDGQVTLLQTVGGRTGVPLPRPVPHAPFVRWQAPLVWTTLALTIRADGSSAVDLVGASAFPRHWVYDETGRVALKSAFADEQRWMSHSFGGRTPWGEHDRPALVVAFESELEQRLSVDIMQRGARPEIRRLPAGATLTEQGRPGAELFLILDGIVGVEVDGRVLGEVGPGAVLGERAILEGGVRTSTVRSTTPVRRAVARVDDLDIERLRGLVQLHRREEEHTPPAGPPSRT